ncbi:MAG: hypothetical protein MRY83_18115, partial [Flavobacteriales bacterium]|nr:hypothetical protein [Flavobacteriales bacterium]
MLFKEVIWRMLFSFLLISAIVDKCAAQTYTSNYHHDTITVGMNDTIFLDSLTVIPKTLIIKNLKGDILSEKHYSLDILSSKLIFSFSDSSSFASHKQLLINYRTFPYNLSQSYFNKPIQLLDSTNRLIKNPFKYEIEDNAEFTFMAGIDKQGSISRGLTFGNNQNASVSSNLNLQLSGKLSDDINILAAITDDNIPIQPEGNTQQLQDFDQVFVQLYNDNNKLTVGDFQLKSPSMKYQKYFKKVQGGSFTNKFIPDTVLLKGYNGKFSLSGAVSRGKFARNIIQGQEGNQGPYRLRGAENENFIVILSGTERVYIDGELLTRGQEEDYIIDYNTSEIIFTAKRIITKDKRISIEFQYSNRNYLRSIFAPTLELSNQKNRFYLAHYNEQDHKNQPIFDDVSDEQKIFLGSIGDSLDKALFPSFQEVEFSNDQVLYEIIDTLGYDSIFLFTNVENKTHFRVTFSDVGQNNGDYVFVQSGANGRVYKWVAPDTVGNILVRNGNFEPIQVLITPKKRSMTTFGGNVQAGEHSKIDFEGSLSQNDINTFSKTDNDDDFGYALSLGVQDKRTIRKDSVLSLTTDIGLERLDQNFQFIERFRAVEFFRSWNLRGVELSDNQNLIKGNLGLNHRKIGQILSYGLESYSTDGNDFSGLRNNLRSDFKQKKWRFNTNTSYTTTSLDSLKTEFIRSKLLTSYDLFKQRIGYRHDIENNVYTTNDSVLSNSYSFSETEYFLSSGDSAKFKYKAYFINRWDRFSNIQGTNLKRGTLGQSYGLNFGLIDNKIFKLESKSIYRKLTILDTNITDAREDENYLGRLEYSLLFLKKAIRANSFYEVGSGLEAKKEFLYLEVNPGQGTHTWIDYDSSGTAELNEFEISVFQDQANYIKVFRPTNEFIKTFNNQFNQVVRIDPKRILKTNKKGWKKLVGRFSTQSSFRVDWKTLVNDASSYNPLSQKANDTSIISINKSLRNSVYFNRTDPKFGLTYDYQNIQNKILSTNGFEWRTRISHEIALRYNMTKYLTLNTRLVQSDKSNASEFFSARNYKFDIRSIEPQLVLQPGTKARV